MVLLRLLPLFALSACRIGAGPSRPDALPDGGAPSLPLPDVLDGVAEIVPPDDPDFPRAELSAAVKEAGLGGLSDGVAVRLIADVPVYRMWNGPDVVDGNGNTNRLGQWWSFDAPVGSRDDYRAAYEVCEAWNELLYVATCTLQAGAVVATGPGQSVSEETCGEDGESYDANPEDWQVYIARAWTREGEGLELNCPDPAEDYRAKPADVSQPEAP